MSTRNYDIAVIGGTLSARIAAALLAKAGQRVLLLGSPGTAPPTWSHSSLFLEKLLGILGGRACFAAPEPIQVISRRARLTLHPDIPLEEELRRELGDSAAPAIRFLTDLNSLGTELENMLWDNGGLVWPTLKAVARFRFLCLRRKIGISEANRPVSSMIGNFPEAARLLLTDLLQGLALLPLTEISLARAALLWSQALRPEQLQGPDFNQLLDKRLDQFHGARAGLEGLLSLDHDGRRWTGGRFKAGGQFHAATFLLGDVYRHDRFSTLPPKHLPLAGQIFQYHLGDLTGQLSPLLESRVICGGEIPLRLTLDAHSGQRCGLLSGTGNPSLEQLRQQLEPVLPFARYDLAPPPAAVLRQAATALPVTTVFDGLPLKLSDNLYCADSTALLPGLGAAGAALLGWTLAEHLGGPKT